MPFGSEVLRTCPLPRLPLLLLQAVEVYWRVLAVSLAISKAYQLSGLGRPSQDLKVKKEPPRELHTVQALLVEPGPRPSLALNPWLKLGLADRYGV